MNDKFEPLFKKIKELTNYAMLIADRTINAINADNPDKVVIVGYLNHANSIISTAKAIYISNSEILERNDIDSLFAQFDIFVMEVLSDLEDNHTYEYSNIEYDRLKEKFNCCVLSQ